MSRKICGVTSNQCNLGGGLSTVPRQEAAESVPARSGRTKKPVWSCRLRVSGVDGLYLSLVSRIEKERESVPTKSCVSRVSS